MLFVSVCDLFAIFNDSELSLVLKSVIAKFLASYMCLNLAIFL